MKSSRFALALIALVAVCSLGYSANAGAAAKSNAYLQNNLPNGLTTAYEKDKECRDWINYAGNPNIRASSFNGRLRDYINATPNSYPTIPSSIERGSSYKYATWVSQDTQGNMSSPIQLQEGDDRVKLRLNNLRFLCRSMVQPDLTRGCTITSVTGGQIARASGWASTTNGREARPNPIGGGCMNPASTGQARYYERIEVYERGVRTATITVPGADREKRALRDSSSRYWFAPNVFFDYVPPTPFMTSTRLTFKAYYRTINFYRSSPTTLSFRDRNTGALRYVDRNSIATLPWSSVRTDDSSYTVVLDVQRANQYNLNPVANVDSSSSSAAGTVNVSALINNSGRDAANRTAATGFARFVVKAGDSYSTSAGTRTLSDYSNYPCDIVDGAQPNATNCQELDKNSAGQTFGTGPTTFFGPSPQDLSSLGLVPGDRVCFMSVVNKYNQASDSENWRYSAPACVLIARAPSVKVLGNDLRVGGAYNGGAFASSLIQGNIQTALGRTWGSWGEYGVISAGPVNSLGSGAGLAGGASSASQASWSKLTHANTGTPCAVSGFGCFGTDSEMGSIPDLAGYFSSPHNGVSAGGLPSGTFSGSRVVRQANVTIGSNITYATAPDARRMPQLIIIADTINIEPDVTRVDAWLIANTINTCTGSGSLSISICEKPLELNGPVMAETLVLRRTAGGDTAATIGDPAETINLRGDTYIWLDSLSRRNGSLKNTAVTELPPRF